jgi:hypothetical protein
MAKAVDTIATLNSAVRTVLAVVVCGALALAGYLGYDQYHAKDRAAAEATQRLKDAEEQLVSIRQDVLAKEALLEQQAEEIRQKEEQIAKLETARRLLKVDHRLARLNILDRYEDENGDTVNLVQFIELNPEGVPITEPRVFKLIGDMIYIDGLSVTFRDEFVETADLERGTSLFSFKRLFTDKQKPEDGVPIDDVGARPMAYGKGGQLSDFEQHIWDNFWTIANDEKQSGELGIANIHGNAPSIKPMKGHSYTFELRASGGPKLRHEGQMPTDPAASN